MKKAILLSLMVLIGFATEAQTPTVLPEAVQINMASQVAPEKDREAVTVYGYDESGKLKLLKKGTNNLICLADDPNKKGVHISCYSVKLEPFMARGRELIVEGKSVPEMREIRKKEAEEGSLQLPDVPSMLYVLDGEEANLNQETGELTNGFERYVIYTPYATTESTGLPDAPFAPGMPWLMDPGTHRAHIMVTPPRDKKKNKVDDMGHKH
ncbi:hypothetical protein [Marixanthomonas spongiae]|uniref:Uncharacterized protein n=1 Tax=Marixanthomonas spongiae TaxID=2174845 RepID=A0A2U0HUQ8_9FLAO|nr:hypothetical protein [Marixanthomonas spongiae]PVW12611.1 hypothetical protein DDV96_14685 [Marixanthomonas spongiae]